MSRNYEKESQWMKNKYVDIRAKIDKSVAEPFKAKLSERGIPYAQWLKDRIAEFMNEDRII